MNEFHLIKIYSILSISSHVLRRNVHCRFGRNISCEHKCCILSKQSFLVNLFSFSGLQFLYLYNMVMLGLCTYLGCIGGFSGGSGGEEPACQCRRRKRCMFDPCIKEISWRRAWQPTPLFLPGDPMDGGAWWATVHRVAKSQKQLCATEHSTKSIEFQYTILTRTL